MCPGSPLFSLNGYFSEVTAAESGVPQGSVLGLRVFLLYVNDLPDLLFRKVRLFADNAKLVSPRTPIGTLLSDLQIIHDWFTR